MKTRTQTFRGRMKYTDLTYNSLFDGGDKIVEYNENIK